jgi:hypothetical protein
MKRNFNIGVNNYDGFPLVRIVYKHDAAGIPVIENGGQVFDHHEPMTLRLFALEALSRRLPGDENLPIDEAVARMKLHDKIAAADGAVEIDIKEAELVLSCLNRQGRDPLVIARMKHVLDTDPAA